MISSCELHWYELCAVCEMDVLAVSSGTLRDDIHREFLPRPLPLLSYHKEIFSVTLRTIFLELAF
jgi:hypothetical protein